MIVRAAPKSHYQWIKDRTQCAVSDGFRAVECLNDAPIFCPYCREVHGRVIGMLGYDCWTLNSVQIHVCLEEPESFWPLIRPAFAYPFEEAGRGVVVGITPADNQHALDFNKRLGLRETYRIKDGWSVGVDMVVQEIRKEDCRWIKRPARKVQHG